MFSMLFQHQSVVGPSGPHNLCFPWFQRCCPLSMELTPCWYSRLFFHHILSIVFLKPTVSIRPSVPPSGSHKCLRFALLADTVHYKVFYLLTYLLPSHVTAAPVSPSSAVILNHISSHFLIPLSDSSFICTATRHFGHFNHFYTFNIYLLSVDVIVCRFRSV